METWDLKFSNIEIIGLALIAFILFIILKVIAKAFPYLIKQPERKKAFLRYFTISEILFWILYTIFVIRELSDSNQIYSFGLFILLMVAGFWLLWYYMKNYISGGVFKLNSNFEINDSVQINEYQGKIVGLGKHSLELESDNGEMIYIPYTKLADAIIIKLHPGEMVLSHSFTLSTANDKKSVDKEEEIRFEILSLPYSSLKKSPVINLIHEDAEHFVFELVVYTLEKDYFFKMEQEIRKKFDVSL
ncbi:mechanosensitive ion channel [Lentimicrobium sp. L6]|uniref:mechanosensitive ion channel domain-containing protein n=1 Tax=Lentimicrobium sp. L6 TaxID=2735916 RepID=UPI001552FD83|nr:mechanosensitive ion channel domain-containing protein [Lentimicrobium sp. L6]NPD84042.1 mechanosensitive ion channel [Lentimicrobium sp. L6]